jgi:hypothetical protein
MAGSARDSQYGAGWIKDLVTVYGRTWGDLATGWSSMLDRMQHDDYTAGKYVADVSKLWEQWIRNVSLLGYPAARWYQGGDHISTLFFVVDHYGGYGNAKVAAIPYGVHPDAKIDEIVLKDAAGNAQQHKVHAEITPDGAHLFVELEDAAQIPRGDHSALITAIESSRTVVLCQLFVRKLGSGPATPPPSNQQVAQGPPPAAQ